LVISTPAVFLLTVVLHIVYFHWL